MRQPQPSGHHTVGHSRRLVPLALSAALLMACNGRDAPVDLTQDVADGTFSRIQRTIFEPGCANCHRTGSSDARQSGLVLTADSSYQQLVGSAAVHPIAKTDGMLRVKPFRADSSLLYHKLAWSPGHHSRDYGNLMPMGTTQGITAGQLEYVRRWIEAGAPRNGHVVDTMTLRDARLQMARFTPLAPPAAGSGFQLTIDSFPVPPLNERELFVYRQLGNTSELFVTRIESRMRPGSHHLLLYTFDETRSGFPCNGRPLPDQVRDIRTPEGAPILVNMLPMACHVFFAGAMTQDFDYRFPPGVALRLPSNAAIDLNAHYVNRSPATFPGQAQANLHTVDRSQVQQVARTLNYANTTFMLPARQRTTIRTEYRMNARTTLLALTSHMHSLGERFEIRWRRGGSAESTVYVNTDWEHPAFTNFATPIVLEAGDLLISVVTYNNVTDRPIGFGLLSTDEMNIIFGYAY